MYLCIVTPMCICMYVYTSSKYEYVYACTNECMHACMYMYDIVCMYLSMHYVRMCVCMYVGFVRFPYFLANEHSYELPASYQ